jgi:integrase
MSVIHVQGLYAAMDRAKKSAETIRLAHTVLRRALKQAVRWRLVPYVCLDVDQRRVAKADITPLDGEQVAMLLRAAATDRLGAIFTVAIATGMRLGELFGLHWADV